MQKSKFEIFQLKPTKSRNDSGKLKLTINHSRHRLTHGRVLYDHKASVRVHLKVYKERKLAPITL